MVDLLTNSFAVSLLHCVSVRRNLREMLF